MRPSWGGIRPGAGRQCVAGVREGSLRIVVGGVDVLTDHLSAASCLLRAARSFNCQTTDMDDVIEVF